MAKRPVILAHQLESICKFVADTELGLRGQEIERILGESNIPDVSPGITKWKRLFNAFAEWQNKHGCSDHILTFLKLSLQPVSFIGKEGIFESRRHEINKRLSFIGVEISKQGTLREVAKAFTITEAEERASIFKYRLEARNVHQEVFVYCNPELLAENYFHAVFEAVKSIADRIRTMTGLYADGNQLADTAFSTQAPLIRINLLVNDTQRSEHIGLCNIIKGLFGIIRNPTAHTPKIKFVIEEQDALEIMSIVSFVHRRLDNAL